MNRIVLGAAAAALFASGNAQAVDLAYGLMGGFQSGGAGRVEAIASHLTPRLPVAVSFGIGHGWVDPGDPAKARRVFINDATDGTPETSGGVWDFRLDGIYWLKVSGLEDVGAFGGVRYSMFSGRFHYVGGNEDFTITSNAWGVGVGLRGALPVNRHWAVAASVGLDWFPQQTMYGHDASYSSNNANVNARTNDQTGAAYAWRDANAAVNQPWLVPSLLIGVVWRP